MPFFKSPSPLETYYNALEKPIKIDTNNLASSLFEAVVTHFKHYPFHSLPFQLKSDRKFPLTTDELIHDLMLNKGGSCFHHNAVFKAILEANHIQSHYIACDVYDQKNNGQCFKMPTHVALVVQHDNQTFLFDPGWGGTCFSLYPLPNQIDAISRVHNYQVRAINEDQFVFEDLTGGEVTPRYRFNTSPVPLNAFEATIPYLKGIEYPFATLFLYMGIHEDVVYRCCNQYILQQTIQGDILSERELNVSERLSEVLSDSQAPLGDYLSTLRREDFIRPLMGEIICSVSTKNMPTL